MKKLLALSALISLCFIACKETEQAKPVFTGHWLGEDDMVFEVFQTNPGENNYTIRNINGDLQAHIEGDTLLTGTNSLDMPFYMRVKGDSAFYQFGPIISTYSRIDAAKYEEIFKGLTPAIVPDTIK
ncbi:hypothetical protein [Hallerella porci]|uniref:DUF4369 domain-containing protein n=1 Tax=Hallerella porci TaxID=1945871 RepID=A0ABX5LP98_9BACT|nr:hypothetical protein [Hallerella porci]PWL04252.1 hypothetical protein B0H50_101267 [Hallerella porci]